MNIKNIIKKLRRQIMSPNGYAKYLGVKLNNNIFLNYLNSLENKDKSEKET